MTIGATWMLSRPRRHSSGLAWLQLTASATTTLLSFAVAILATTFMRVPSEETGYTVLALGLVGLLIVPLVTLGTSTARLAARSRDERLATLRLLGTSARKVRQIAVAEITLLAAVGVTIGSIASLSLPFALSLLTVHGERLTADQMWPPLWFGLAIPPALIGIAALSALLGLRRVTISPLGVRTRQDAPRLSRMRLVIAGAAIGCAILVTQMISPEWGTTVVIIALMLAVLAVMAVLGIAGPFVVSVIARRRVRRTADGAQLVAMRGILDDPKAAWRQVSAVALTSFILVPAGSLTGYLDVIQNSESRAIMTDEQLLLFADARTMLIAVVAISFVIVACQIAITQSAAVLERRDLYVALDRIGIPASQMMRMRRIGVMMPATVAVTGAALAALAFGFALIVLILVMAPLFALAIALLLAVGLLLIRVGVSATRPLLRDVLAAPQRGE